MGILLITWNFPPRHGGIENLMAQLSAGLQKKHSVFVIANYAKEHDKRVFRAPWPGLIAFACYALWRGVFLLSCNRNVEIILGGSAMVAPFVCLLARIFGRKAIVQTHGLDLVYDSFLYQALCVRWLKYCDAIIANSNYTATLAAERGVSPTSICVIPLGVDVARFAPASNVHGIKQEFRITDRQIILFVGRLARRKGLREFVENCLPIIVREIPRVYFFVAGGNPTASLTHQDDVFSEIEELVQCLGLQDHVRLWGDVTDDQLLKLYQCSDVVVLPALASTEDVEGFGLVLLEAAATGKPVVATEVGGIPDAVENGKSGVLVKQGDYRLLAQSIMQYLNDDQLRLQAGENGRKRVRTRFTWELITGRYEELFLSLQLHERSATH
jgi:phosphatidylinositol alpha-1,6-mannosyltransferase